MKSEEVFPPVVRAMHPSIVPVKSRPYDCGSRSDPEHEHNDYCGVGACQVCLHVASVDGLPPHGEIMEATRTMTIYMNGSPYPLFKGRVCFDCDEGHALRGVEFKRSDLTVVFA